MNFWHSYFTAILSHTQEQKLLLKFKQTVKISIKTEIWWLEFCPDFPVAVCTLSQVALQWTTRSHCTPRQHASSRQEARVSSQYKDNLSGYRDSHYKDKAPERPSHLLDNGNSYTGKITSLYWDNPRQCWKSRQTLCSDQIKIWPALVIFPSISKFFLPGQTAYFKYLFLYQKPWGGGHSTNNSNSLFSVLLPQPCCSDICQI